MSSLLIWLADQTTDHKFYSQVWQINGDAFSPYLASLRYSFWLTMHLDWQCASWTVTRMPQCREWLMFILNSTEPLNSKESDWVSCKQLQESLSMKESECVTCKVWQVSLDSQANDWTSYTQWQIILQFTIKGCNKHEILKNMHCQKPLRHHLNRSMYSMTMSRQTLCSLNRWHLWPDLAVTVTDEWVAPPLLGTRGHVQTCLPIL